MIFVKKIISVILIICVFVSCKKPKNKAEATINTNEIIHAKGFSIVSYDTFSVLEVKNTYPESKEVFTYILHKKNQKIPDSLKKYTRIQIPVQKIIVSSTTHIPSLEMLGVEDKLIAFPSTQYISSKKTRTLINEGKIRDIGNNQELNTEVILEINPDVIIGYNVDSESKSYKNLSKSGQKVIYNSDWTEKTPLGKAEWIKLFGVLFDKQEQANSLFSNIKKDYLATLDLAQKATSKPSIFAGSIYQDNWVLPQGDSWAALFMKDANGNYLWNNTKGTGSLSLSFESVLDKAKDADFWIGPGQFTSIKEILNENINYKHFKAVKNNKVYSFSVKKGETGGVIYYEMAPNRPDLVLKDLVKILHPELLPKYELVFFELLK